MDFAALKTLGEDTWRTIDEINRLSAEPSPFLTAEYLRVWDSCFSADRQKIFFTGRKGGDIVGIAPFYCREHPKTYFLLGGKSLSDKLGLVIREGFEEEFIGGFLSFIAGGKDFKKSLFVIHNLYGNSAQADFFLDLSRTGSIVSVKQVDVSPFVDLPGDYDLYLASLPRKKRHEIRRKMNRAREELGDLEIEAWNRLDERSGVNPLSEFIRLHMSSNREKLNFWRGKRREFFEGVAEEYSKKGWLQIFFLLDSANKERVSGLMIFDFQGEYLLYNSGFDPLYKKSSPGLVLIAKAIEEAIVKRRKKFDFLRGEEKYKYDLGGQARPVYRVEIRI